MLAIARKGAALLVGAGLLVPTLHATPVPRGSGEDDCVHLTGYGGGAGTLPPSTRVLRAGTGSGGGAGGTLDAGICAVENARQNRSTPIKTTADFVPITGDDSLGFYCVYGVKASTTGGIGGNVGIYLFDLGPGEALIFGSGYGNIAGANLFDAAYDMERVDQVLRFCMGKVPAQTTLRMVAPHGHGDHINPACNRELERLGYRIGEIAFHTNDFTLVNAMGWTTADRALFRVLPAATTCLQELLSFPSPLGKIWFYERPGHTAGAIDLVIDVKNDAGNRFVVRGSQPSSPCTPITGQREIVNAHGNVELLALAPTLVDIAPQLGTSLGGTLLTLTGTGFLASGAGAHHVLVDGKEASEVTVVNDTTLTCRTPVGPPGQLVGVVLYNNNGKSVYSGTYFYNALPSLTSLTPASGDWRGGTLVQVRGSGFLLTSGVNEVYFGLKRATSVVVKSDSLLTCRTPSGTQGSLVSVKLRNPNGEVTLPDGYLYVADLAIQSISPTSGTSLGGTSVQITGLAFTGSGAAPSVTFGGLPASQVTLVSDTTVTAVVPPGVPGANVDIVLTNIAGSASYSGFRYHATPDIALVTPAIGRASGGTLVTLSGSGFVQDSPGVNQVRFGGVPATEITVLDDATLTCRTPAGEPGAAVNATLTNENGTATQPFAFVYAQPLALVALVPASGTAQGGTPVTIQGSGFLEGPAGTSTVLFGGVPASGVVVVDDATLTCVAPPGLPLAVVDLEVTNENGTVALPGAFRYHAEPALATLSPNHGHAGAFTPVTITGSGFLADDAGFALVVVGGVTASEIDVVDDTTLTCVIPPGPAGTSVDVILATQNGSASLPGGFRYHAAPTLSSLTPTSGAASSQPRITLTGTGFVNDDAGLPTVTFGGQPATSISVLGDQTLRCNAPAGTPGQTVDVVVTNARGTASLPGSYRFHARPSVTAAVPERGTFQGGTRVTLSGAGFQVDQAGPNVVSFGGALATNVVVVDDTSLACTTPPGVLNAVVDIVLSNANGTGTLTGGFSYSVAAPTLTALTPASGPAHAPGTAQITGSGFVVEAAGTNVVTFGGQAAAVTVVDDGQLSVQVPAGTPGTSVDVALQNANGSAQLLQGFRYHALPSLAGLSPAAGSSLGGSSVLVTGSGFLSDAAGTNVVTFGGTPALAVTVIDDGTLSCTAPPGPAGATVEVRVVNANGESGSGSFGYHALPALLALEPTFGPVLGGATVTLTGSGFLANEAGPNTVRFGTRSAFGVVVLNDSTLTCITPRGVSGYVDVSLTNANGTIVLARGYHYGKLPPEITSVGPASGPGSGQNLVTIHGRGFLDSSAGANRVKFGTVLADNVITVDDATVLCAAPAGTPGAVVDVAVNNNNGTATASAAYRYHDLPTLLAVDPPQGEPLGATRVTLTGTGFLLDGAGPTTVLFGSVRARDVLVLDDTHVSCRVYGGSPGSVLDVTLRNANGSATLLGAFSVTGGPPSVRAVTPDHGPFLGGTSVRIEGKGFAAAPVRVTFGQAEALSLVVKSDSELTCVSPPGTLGESVTLTIRTRDGVAAILGGFTYEAIRPVLTAVAPASGPAAGGTRVTLSGSNFQADGAGTTHVRFGGIEATNLAILGDGSLACDAPAGAPGTSVDVELENGNGTALLARAFRYHARPSLTALAPVSGVAAGGTSVTLTGQGFKNDAPGQNLVRFGAVPALNVVVVSDTSLTCTTPPGTPGTSVDVSLTNANGQATLVAGFRYRIVPVLTAVEPERGPLAGGTTLTLAGSGFLADSAGPASVTLGGRAASNVLVLNDSSLTCTAPDGLASGPVDVVVSNANGSASLVGAFTYFVPPSLSALTPARGPAAGGTSVTVQGAGFLADGVVTNLVLFDGVAALDVLELSDTELTCTTPPGIAGSQATVLLANENGIATLPGAFRYHGAPSVTALVPSHGPAQGASVEIQGSGFLADEAGANVVTFGGLAASDVVVLNDATLSCRAPAGTPGATVEVTVSNANGTGSLAGAFRYHALPALLSATPDRGPATGGTAVTLTGSGFLVDEAGAPEVRFGSALASDVLVLDDGSLTCTAPPGTPGLQVALTLTNANGTASLAAGFRYAALPTLAQAAPAHGSELGGTVVTLTGTGFLVDGAGDCSVLFGTEPALDVLVLGDKSLACTAPPGTGGTVVAIQLSNLNGSATLPAAFRYDPLPRLTALSIDHGTALGGTSVVLTGSGLADANAGTTQVRFGGVDASGVLVLADDQVSCIVPAGVPGALVDVELANQNGSATLTAAYRYHASPALLAVAPTRGSSAANSLVTLTGSGFLADQAGTNTVLFGSMPASAVVVASDGELSCLVAPQPKGTVVTVRVQNQNGEALLADAFAFDAPPPTLSGLDPVRGTSTGGTRVTLTGSGFLDFSAGTNTVAFGAAPASDVLVLADGLLECTTPPGPAGADVDVSVSNVNGSAVLVGAFRYFAPPPTLASISVPSGKSTGGIGVTLTGTGFLAHGAGTNSVSFGGVPATGLSVLSDTSLTCTVPAGTAGAVVDVELSNLNGAAVLASAFRYHAVPTLTSILPASGTSLGGTLVTVRGSGFLVDGAGTNTVLFGGLPAASVTVVDDTRLTCRTPSGTAGSIVNLSLANQNGAAELAGAFRYHAKPTLTAVTPASGPAAGGNRVTLTGTGFLADGAVVNIVAFGGVTATGVSVLSNTSLQCNVPAGTSATSVQVTVANVNGTALLPAGYRYHAKPSLLSVSPTGGPLEGGTTVTLTGSGFLVDAAGTNSVTFGGVAASAVNVIGDTQLTCVTPPGPAGAVVDVSLSNANGGATLVAAYTYASVPVPVVASTSPSKGSTQGSTLVTLTGSGFQPGMGVSFGGQAASSVTVLDESTITCLTPPFQDAAWVDVRVEGLASASLPLGYQYVPPPTLIALEPPFGSPQGGSLIVLEGSGFLQDGGGETLVTFGDVPAASTTVLDDQHLVCETPPGTLLEEADVVVANEIGSSRLARGFRWQRALATDIDGDGRGDLIVSSPGDDAYARDGGSVRVFLGHPLPLADRSSAEADLTALPRVAATEFGMPVASGDVNGDGRPELLIGAPGEDSRAKDAGSVYVYRGPLGASAASLETSQAELELYSERSGDRFGSALLLLDFDRNGVLDVLVGAPGRTGAAQLFLGSHAGLATTPALVVSGPVGNEAFATSLAAGDLDGDGWLDLVIGAPNALLKGTNERVGEVRIYRGGPDAFLVPDPAPWRVLTGLQNGETFGRAVACGDVDGDGLQDLIVGAPENATAGAGSGAVYVFCGGASFAGGSAAGADFVLTPEGAGDRFGRALALGDTNGDGRADLLVGAPGHASWGRAYLFLGAASFTRTSAAEADFTFDGELGTLGEFGAAVALLDVDGNGFDDAVVTAPGLDSFGSDLGRVYVFGAPITQSRSSLDDDGTLTGGNAGDQLGRAMSRDL